MHTMCPYAPVNDQRYRTLKEHDIHTFTYNYCSPFFSGCGG